MTTAIGKEKHSETIPEKMRRMRAYAATRMSTAAADDLIHTWRWRRLFSSIAHKFLVDATVYSTASGYSSSLSNLSGVSIARDNVFGDNSTAQIAQQTPTMSGGVDTGYTATAVIGIAR